MRKRAVDRETLVTLMLLLIALHFMIQVSTTSLATYSNNKSSITQTYAINETWVDDDYNETTIGWGLSHFKNIQDGINAVSDGGTVHVASGSYYESVVVNRTVFLVGEDKSRTIIDGNYTQDSVLSITANYVSIEGFAIQNCIYLGREKGGIHINSWYNNISNIYFTQNWIDITVFGRYNRIRSCNMNASFWNIKVFADNNSILENHFNISYSAITLTSANGNSIEYNTITDEYIGISLYESTQNKIAANFAFNCSQNALGLESYSTNNIVTQNTFSNSNQGVNENANSGTNTFYHNSFINNTLQVSLGGSENKLDDGYPSGGNYWSDNTGEDDKRGPNQDEIGSDGIFDVAHTVDINNRDHYPLTKPFRGPNDIGIVSITCSKTAIPQAENVSITTKTVNFGFNSENVNLTLRLNSTLLTNADAVIIGRNSTVFLFAFNVSSLTKGRYILEAYVSAAANETDTTDNTQTLWIAVTIRGDINGDFTVNILDAIILGNSFLATPGTQSWNPNADLNGDGIVNILDAIILGNHFLQHYP